MKALFAFGVLAALLSPAAALCDETFERALALASEQRHEEARAVLDGLLQREPSHPRGRVLQGVLRTREGRVSEAIDIFEALRRDHPDMAEPYNNLAVLYALQGRLDDARTILLATLERAPDPVVYANLGDVYTKLARRAYRRARELEARAGARPERETPAAIALPETPVGSLNLDLPAPLPESHTMVAEARDPVPAPATAPEAIERPMSVVMQRREPAAEPPDPGEGSPVTLPATPEAASAPPAFCAYAGGFQGRRAVADAALWLQSYGAEVLEVRHEERQIARSYRVYLPPFATSDEAAAKLREIRGRGVRDVMVIRDGDLANGISFGIYTKADNMHQRVAALDRLGYPVQSRADAVEIVEEYAIKARAAGPPDSLDAALTSRFPGRSIRIVDCG